MLAQRPPGRGPGARDGQPVRRTRSPASGRGAGPPARRGDRSAGRASRPAARPAAARSQWAQRSSKKGSASPQTIIDGTSSLRSRGSISTVSAQSIDRKNRARASTRAGEATSGSRKPRTRSSSRRSGCSRATANVVRAASGSAISARTIASPPPPATRSAVGAKAGGGQPSCVSQLVSVSDRIRSGCRAARIWATPPPLSLPTRSTRSSSRPSSSATSVSARPAKERSASGRSSVQPCAGRSGQMQRRMSATPSTTPSHRSPFRKTPCTKRAAGPSPRAL